jgi:hypothetical protein
MVTKTNLISLFIFVSSKNQLKNPRLKLPILMFVLVLCFHIRAILLKRLKIIKEHRIFLCLSEFGITV